MYTHASRAKSRGSISTHHLGDDKEVEGKSTMLHLSEKLSEPKHERFDREELLFLPSQEPPDESECRQFCLELEEYLVEGTSEGEAPETMTAAAGLSQSRSLASKAARAVERYSFI